MRWGEYLNRAMFRRASILMATSAFIVVGCWYALNAWRVSILDTKSVRVGQGIVERKEHIVFNRLNNGYLNQSGHFIEREPGFEEYRLYYRVVDFGLYSERKRTILEDTERRRIVRNDLRFAIVSRDLYDSIQQGDIIQFNNQFILRDDVMTWGAGVVKNNGGGR